MKAAMGTGLMVEERGRVYDTRIGEGRGYTARECEIINVNTKYLDRCE